MGPESLSADLQILEVPYDESQKSDRIRYLNKLLGFDRMTISEKESVSPDLLSLELDENGLVLGPVRYFSKFKPLGFVVVPLPPPSEEIKTQYIDAKSVDSSEDHGFYLNSLFHNDLDCQGDKNEEPPSSR